MKTLLIVQEDPLNGIALAASLASSDLAGPVLIVERPAHLLLTPVVDGGVVRSTADEGMERLIDCCGYRDCRRGLPPRLQQLACCNLKKLLARAEEGDNWLRFRKSFLPLRTPRGCA